MDYVKVKVKFTVDPTRKDTWVSDIGYVQKEHGKWLVYPSWQNKIYHGFMKRASAEWWIKTAYAATHREDGSQYKEGDDE